MKMKPEYLFINCKIKNLLMMAFQMNTSITILHLKTLRRNLQG